MGNTSVFGIYPDRITVGEAIETLVRAGYRRADVAVLVPENSGSKDFGHVKSNRGPEGAAAGTALGAATGALIGWLVATHTVALPGLASIAALAPTMAALASAGCGGALGWLIGLYLGLGVPEYVAKRYAGRKRRGGILVSVHCDSPQWTRKARQVLKETGAQSIASISESAADFAVADKPAPRVVRITETR
jgi:hypothetical protein